MVANKFATMLHRNTHKLTLILVYAVLEWILIILLLLNALFTYLITKFANYFGLKPPCLWCSRIDHVLGTGNCNNSSYRDLVCEAHATEISNLAYCSNHRRLAESQYMCGDCLASLPNKNDESIGITRRIAFISWVSKDTIENGENILKCSCCNESLSSYTRPPYLLFKPSWGAFKYTQKGSLIIEAADGSNCKKISKPSNLARYFDDSNEIERNEEEGFVDEHEMLSDVESLGLKLVAEKECSTSESNLQSDEKEDQIAGSPRITEQDSADAFVHQSLDDRITIIRCFGEDDSLAIINPYFGRNFDCEFNRLIPVELIDLSTAANFGTCNLMEEDLGKQDHQYETFDSALLVKSRGGDEALLIDENGKTTSFEEVETMEMDMENVEKSAMINLEETNKDLIRKASEQVISPQEVHSSNCLEVEEMKELDDLPAQEEETKDFKLFADQTKSKTSIEITQAQESTPALPCKQNHASTSGNGAEIPNATEIYMAGNELDSNCSGKITTEGKLISADKNEEGMIRHLSMRSEHNEAEEEKFPETPTSVDSVHYLNKNKLLMFEKRESGAEESLDGSVASEMDAGDPVITIERLKTALKSERKALSVLYAELEEERSASAIAANQTMAMINRLQEEKAAMQMEALQYQRMMEEQSEYDQEALQLLNELMIKREKEKQELEKELELCRKKVLDYEAKEKMRKMRRIKNGSTRSRNSSASCSNPEDTDELSIDLNREARDEEGSICGNQESGNNNTPDDEVQNLKEIALDCVKQMNALDDSLVEFEDERLSILDQLKALEEKLLRLGDKEFNEDEDKVEEFEESYESSTPEENGLSKDKQYPERKIMGSMAKSLLPLLDAAENESEEGLTYEENLESEYVELESRSFSKFELDSKKIGIEEEVDQVYERLQALEADKEFLKHCVGSIKKGDKGIDLLQEILQHLRDLRAVELCVRNMSDDLRPGMNSI